MFIAMNRFKIALGAESQFIEIWKNRETYLDEVPGFMEFHLLQGPSDASSTLFISHSQWNSREAFEAWTQSEAFQKAHSGAKSAKEIYLGPPQFEGCEVVL
ncbi:MAG: antibiotic biosynthesis monooxygenase [Deltaproteobacteria bacterium]|nr:antibiotic biosynthesis monooxygenase [Deltaproteobacteria bacterium]